VTNIGDTSFFGCKKLTSIVIPDGVTSIGLGAFQSCEALTNVVIPDGVTSIGTFAFAFSGLTSVTIPGTVASVDSQAFSGCRNLRNVTIRPGVKNIGGGAFFYCISLTDITVPDSVTNIDTGTFQSCLALTAINVDPTNASFLSDESGVLFNKEKTVLMQYPGGKTSGDYTIPSGVEKIGDSAFTGCVNLTSVTIPSGVTSIGTWAFAECVNLTNVTMPDGLTSMGNGAFSNCTGLTSVNIPAGMASIGEWAFRGCAALSEIVIKHSMTNLPSYFVEKNRFESDLALYVPESVISVGGTPFSLMPPGDLSKNLTIYGLEGSFIQVWANANGVAFEPIDGTIAEGDSDDAWLNVPYQYIIKTNTPDNVNLRFEIVGGRLPNGLSLMQKGGIYEGLPLLSGQFHGAPLEAGEDFEIEVEVRADVETWDYLLDRQVITLTVKAPDDADLAFTNDYKVSDFVGDPTVPGVPEDFVLRGSRAADGLADQIFRAADSPKDIAAGLSNYRYFLSFWIDGRELRRGPVTDPNAEYDADDGSTVVTIYAKTFQSLENGEHTLAAEFMTRTRNTEGGEELDMQMVAAQKFTLELTGASLPNMPGNNSNFDTVPARTTPPETNETDIGDASDSAWDNPFGDVSESDWFYDDALYVTENGLMNGTSATSFSPQTPMTRAMLVTVLFRLAAPARGPNTTDFIDVPLGLWYSDAVAWASGNGLVSGVGDGGFAPGEDVTRQDLATIITRYADFAGLSIPALRPVPTFADDALTADYARDALRALATGGILNGKPASSIVSDSEHQLSPQGGNIFDPAGRATRAEAAAILHRFIETTN
jgi:hypothetical protein